MEKFYIYRNNLRNGFLIMIFFLATVLAIFNGFKDKSEINILTFIQPLIFLILVYIVLKRRNYFVSVDSEKMVLHIPRHKSTTILKKDVKNVDVEKDFIQINTKDGSEFRVELKESSLQIKEGLKRMV